MSEIEKNIRVVEIDYVCDECKDGLMRKHGNIALLCTECQYLHKCNKCGAEKTFAGGSYPRIGYRYIDK